MCFDLSNEIGLAQSKKYFHLKFKRCRFDYWSAELLIGLLPIEYWLIKFFAGLDWTVKKTRNIYNRKRADKTIIFNRYQRILFVLG